MTDADQTAPLSTAGAAANPAALPNAAAIPGALVRYRTLAWITGIWLLFLVGEMIAKYGFGNDGFVFKREVRGVTEVHHLDRKLLGSLDARRLHERLGHLQDVYGRAAKLRRKDKIDIIHGPRTLLDAVYDTGRKGLDLQRYRGADQLLAFEREFPAGVTTEIQRLPELDVTALGLGKQRAERTDRYRRQHVRTGMLAEHADALQKFTDCSVGQVLAFDQVIVELVRLANWSAFFLSSPVNLQ